jgi:hypothetical protein
MGADIEEFAEMPAGLRNRPGIGHADAIEACSVRLLRKL